MLEFIGTSYSSYLPDSESLPARDFADSEDSRLGDLLVQVRDVWGKDLLDSSKREDYICFDRSACRALFSSRWEHKHFVYIMSCTRVFYADGLACSFPRRKPRDSAGVVVASADVELEALMIDAD